jgi:hypothetical protein
MGKAPKRGIYNNTYRTLEMPLKGAFIAIYTRH